MLVQVNAWSESPSPVLLGESQVRWERLRSLRPAGKVAGPEVHDARIEALCLRHSVKQLRSADRDFGRFSAVTVANPLITRGLPP